MGEYDLLGSGGLSDKASVGSRMKRKLPSLAVSQVKTWTWPTDALGVTHSTALSSLKQGARLCMLHGLSLATVSGRHVRERLLLSARAGLQRRTQAEPCAVTAAGGGSTHH